MQQQSNKKLQNKTIGKQGEVITANFLKRKGFLILEMNYHKKWGEIDVIARKDNKIHFVEVKSVSYETKKDLDRSVLHRTWRPEENVHALKLKKIARAIETWIIEQKWKGDWQIDVASVRIVPRETYATIMIIDNVVLE